MRCGPASSPPSQHCGLHSGSPVPMECSSLLPPPAMWTQSLGKASEPPSPAPWGNTEELLQVKVKYSGTLNQTDTEAHEICSKSRSSRTTSDFHKQQSLKEFHKSLQLQTQWTVNITALKMWQSLCPVLSSCYLDSWMVSPPSPWCLWCSGAELWGAGLWPLLFSHHATLPCGPGPRRLHLEASPQRQQIILIAAENKTWLVGLYRKAWSHDQKTLSHWSATHGRIINKKDHGYSKKKRNSKKCLSCLILEPRIRITNTLFIAREIRLVTGLQSK